MRRFSIIAWILISLGLVASLVVFWGRSATLQIGRRVELALDYRQTSHLAAVQGFDLYEFLRLAREAGVTTIALKGKTLEELERDGHIRVLAGPAFIDELRLAGKSTADVDPNWVYLLGDVATLEWLQRGLEPVLGPDRVRMSPAALMVAADPVVLRTVEVGFFGPDVLRLEEMGFRILPILTNRGWVDEDYIAATFAEIEAIGGVEAIFLAPPEVFGYPDAIEVTARLLEEGGYSFAVLEGYSVRGGEILAEAVGFKGIRVFPPYPHQNPVSFSLAVKDRNNRIFFIKPLQTGNTPRATMMKNLRFIESISQELEASGYEIGPAESFERYEVPLLLQLALLGGLLGGVYLLLRTALRLMGFDAGPAAVLSLALGLVGIAGLLSPFNQLARQAMALMAALTFPALGSLGAGLFLTSADRKGPARLLLVVLGASLLSTVGGVLVNALLGDVVYVLKLASFRGVKLSYLGPPAAVALAWALLTFRRDESTLLEAGRRGWRAEIRVWHLLVGALALALAIVYVGRSGHTLGIPVPDLERLVRNYLERLLVARPRFKEFFIGHPALFLAAWAAHRGYGGLVWPLVFIGAIGQTSLVNTFVHVHIPVSMSFLRTANGLVLGLVLAVLAIAFVEGIRLCVRRSAYRGVIGDE